MVMAGENAAHDVDEEVYGNDGAERHEAQEASARDRRTIADADQAGQLDISGEAKSARTLLLNHPQTARMAHNATHVPFRDWCPFCVASRGRSSPHRRVVVNKTACGTRVVVQLQNLVRECLAQGCCEGKHIHTSTMHSYICKRQRQVSEK